MDHQTTILVTGGAGYIGSHTSILLLEEGYDVIILDNLCNSSIDNIKRIEKITQKNVTFVQGDIRDVILLDQIFRNYKIDAVIHFAGLKSVNESMVNPLEYFDNNINGTITLLKEMQKVNIHCFVFSSSATVYNADNICPLHEDMPANKPNNNYGYTKLLVEELLHKQSLSNRLCSFAILRYFNPIGAHPSGLIGENPKGTPNNLLPYLSQVAIGQRDYLSVYGGDYPTKDGTGIRDYIHVMDLAKAHIKALENRLNTSGFRIWNIGTGIGYSVLEIIDTFEKVNNIRIPYKIVSRREGDVAISYANPSRAQSELGWSTKYNLQDMLQHAWNWAIKL